MRVHGFPPVADRRARILILGSMPGTASLTASHYYAHPRNTFWRCMESLLELPAGLSFEQRYAALRDHRIALWDVLHACTRPGSLDADIEEATLEANDFQSFLAAHSGIGAVFFNGAKAEQSWRRHVLPDLPAPWASLPLTRLPSTSPANASLSFEDKLRQWRAILHPLNEAKRAEEAAARKAGAREGRA